MERQPRPTDSIIRDADAEHGITHHGEEDLVELVILVQVDGLLPAARPVVCVEQDLRQVLAPLSKGLGKRGRFEISHITLCLLMQY